MWLISDGFYVYTDVNESSSFLLSPELSLRRNQTFCLTFWYYVYGRPAAAILRVYVSRDQAYSRPEWSRRQSQENEWLKGEVVVNTNHPLQVRADAALLLTLRALMAITVNIVFLKAQIV